MADMDCGFAGAASFDEELGDCPQAKLHIKTDKTAVTRIDIEISPLFLILT